MSQIIRVKCKGCGAEGVLIEKRYREHGFKCSYCGCEHCEILQ